MMSVLANTAGWLTTPMKLLNDILLVMEDNELMRARFIDPSKAFDSLNDTGRLAN